MRSNWYKSTNTDAADYNKSNFFTNCFTGKNVQILAQLKLLDLSQIAQMTASSKKAQLALELYEIVPVLSEVMWDADDDVVSAATTTLGKSFEASMLLAKALCC